MYNSNNYNNNDNVKSILERHFSVVLINSFQKLTYFCEKSCTLTYFKAKQVLRERFSTNQENDSKMIFVATANNLENLKT